MLWMPLVPLWQNPGMGDDAADRFLFRIDAVFTIAGRGTAVSGFIEHDAVRAGDRLRLIRADGTEGPVVVCRSVEFVDRSVWRPGDPVTVGLIVSDLSGHDAGRGDTLAGEAPSTRAEKS
jgi:translation elongation factor EF-Tu-like GTPase